MQATHVLRANNLLLCLGNRCKMQFISKAKIKHIKRLAQKKYRVNHNQYVVEGEKLVNEVLNHPGQLDYLVIRADLRTLMDTYQALKDICFLADAPTFTEISNLVTPPGVLAVMKIPNITMPESIEGRYFYLDGIRDPGNMGTIIRSADWFGLDGVFCSGGTVDPYNPKCIQASMGSILNMHPVVKPISDLRDACPDMKIIGADAHGQSLETIDLSAPVMVVIGSESHGLSTETRKICDDIVAIEGSNKKIAESLNAGVTAAIFGYALNRS
jgi:TrmH family RNA methyltransferase